jgi:glycerophosphoryl diester phosphodiesterase
VGTKETGTVLLWFALCMEFIGMTMAMTPSEAHLVAGMHPKRPVVIAHRGASHAAPENTLAAYKLAAEEGASVAETDVQLTLDGGVIAMHDDTLDRTTDGTGTVGQLTSAQIAALDAGTWFGRTFAGEPVPTLDALLEAATGNFVLCIEIKAGQGIVPRIIEILDARKARDLVLIFSFDYEQVALAKALAPDIPALALFNRPGNRAGYGNGPIHVAKTLKADLIGVDFNGLTVDFVARAHAAHFPVFVYTVDAPEDVRAAAAMGVDGIITNQPRATQDVLNALPDRVPTGP